MRILHVLNHIRETGNGIVNVALDLACLQAGAGHDVAVASAGGGNVALLTASGVRHFTLDQRRSALSLLRVAPAFAAIVRTFRPSVVHAHMVTGLVVAKALQPLFGYRLVTTVHNEFARSASLMGWADRVIAVSEAVAAAMIRRGTARAKVRVVLNGTLGSPRRGRIEDAVPESLAHPAILTVAGMNRRKGIGDLISAFDEVAAGHPDAQLYLVGHGPERAAFEAQAAASAAAARIHFEGLQQAPERYLVACDVFVLASHADPAPLVLPEAREAGCAIIATSVDGIPQLLDDGNAGILVPPRRPAELAAALTRLLENPAEREQWRARARKNVSRFTAARVAAETTAVYRELVPA